MKQITFPRLKTFLICSALLTGANGRTWTSADGSKSFDAKFKSYDAETGEVVVTLRNGRVRKFNQSFLSADDIIFLKSQGGGSSLSVGELPEILPDPDGKDADMSKPVQVYILLGQSNMLDFGKATTLKGIAAE